MPRKLLVSDGRAQSALPKSEWIKHIDCHSVVACCPDCGEPAHIRIGTKTFNMGELYIVCDDCCRVNDMESARLRALEHIKAGRITS